MSAIRIAGGADGLDFAELHHVDITVGWRRPAEAFRLDDGTRSRQPKPARA
jgi:hypothetical protein